MGSSWAARQLTQAQGTEGPVEGVRSWRRAAGGQWAAVTMVPVHDELAGTGVPVLTGSWRLPVPAPVPAPRSTEPGVRERRASLPHSEGQLAWESAWQEPSGFAQRSPAESCAAGSRAGAPGAARPVSVSLAAVGV